MDSGVAKRVTATRGTREVTKNVMAKQQQRTERGQEAIMSL